MKFFFSGLSLLLALSFSAPSLQAQAVPQQPGAAPELKTDYNDDQLKQFTEAASEVEKIQQSAEAQMISIIEENGLDLETFNKIAMAQQNPNADASGMDAEDMKKYDEASGDLQKVQMEMQPKMVEAIESTGMEIQLYQEIMMAYQQSPELQAKVQAMMEK